MSPPGLNPSSPRAESLFINRLDELINLKHSLVRLANLIEATTTERIFAAHFTFG